MAGSGVALCLVLALCLGLYEAQRIEPIRKQDLEALTRRTQSMVQAIMDCTGIQYLNVAFLGLKRHIDITKAYRINKGGSENVHIGSSFCIGGATQAFTGVLLAKLIDEHENMTMDTPIQDILGRRIVLPDFYRADNINLKDILSMRSGLAGMDIVPIAKPYDADRLRENLRYAPRVTGFREKVVYNEVLFSLIDEVVQVLGGDSWANLLKRHILEPLGMTGTFVLGGEEPPNDVDLVTGSVKYHDNMYGLPYAANSGREIVAPASGICTSARDMSLWLRFLLYNGQYGEQQIIREDALKMTYVAIQARGPSEDPRQRGYREAGRGLQVPYTRESNAFGWITGSYRGNDFISQDGSLPGYQALATIIPSESIAVYTSFSADEDDESFAVKVFLNIYGLDLVMRGDGQGSTWYSERNVCRVIREMTALHKEQDMGSVATFGSGNAIRPLQDYEGVFVNYAYGDISVSFNKSKDDTLTLEYGKGLFQLSPTHVNDTFMMTSLGGPLWYITNADYYHSKQHLYAVFSFDPRDTEQRITSVEIAGFDKDHDPVFSINARPPRIDNYGGYRAQCSAAGLFANVLPILLLVTIIYFR